MPAINHSAPFVKEPEVCQNILEAIITALCEAPIKQFHLGLYGGSTGVLIFLQQVKQFVDSPKLDGLIEKHLDNVQSSIANVCNNTSLANGIAGIAWGWDFLAAANGAPNTDIEDTNDTLDQYLIEYLSNELGFVEFELIKGLTGIALYGLSRSELPTGNQIATLAI